MPFPNEHAFRLQNPDKFDSFRRTEGSEQENIPKTISVIWGHVKGGSENDFQMQALRFPTKDWTYEEAKKWIEDHDYKPIESEPASQPKSHDAPVFKYIDFKVMSMDDLTPLAIQIQEPANPERVVRFRASDDTLDRQDEVILPSGWDLTDWIRNPVIMQFHDYSMFPLGRGVAVGIIDNALMIDVEFDPPEVDESADMVFRKVKHGSVKAGSVGFIPLEWITPSSKAGSEILSRYPKAKRIYTKQSLLEFTICPIPANPNAIAASMAKMYSKSLGLEPLEKSAIDGSLSGLDSIALKIVELSLNANRV